MYVFDKQVLSKDLKPVADILNIPKYFEDDLFKLLDLYSLEQENIDKEDKEVKEGVDTQSWSLSKQQLHSGNLEQRLCRPDWRWLIAGPTRSGSSFHVDPNGTSAFNACLSGSKKWILFPPHSVPPGVIPTQDGSEVKTPV